MDGRILHGMGQDRIFASKGDRRQKNRGSNLLSVEAQRSLSLR